jgi:hypothetical protein
MKNLLFVFEVVGMLTIFDGSAGHSVILARPGAEIDHAASLRTERAKAIRGRRIDRFLADRTTHRSATRVESARSIARVQRRNQ